MQIKLISFSESKVVSMNVAHEIIADRVKKITGVDEGFLFCGTQKEMFSGVKDGIENADVILVAVDVSRFISTKAALFRALGFKCRINSKITELINSDACIATLNENQINAHAAIPVGGEAFVTIDGLFSGFGIESGRQKLIFVPIDERRIEVVFENGLDDFLLKGAEKSAEEAEDFPDEKKETVSDIPKEMEGYVQPIENFEPPVQPQYEEIYSSAKVEEKEEAEEKEVENEFDDVVSSSCGENVTSDEMQKETNTFDNMSAISSRGVRVAFARQSENGVYTRILSEYAPSNTVSFVDFALDKSLTDDMKRKENVASNARKAMKQANADFAVAMSEIYYDSDGVGYVFATLADVQKSSVFKIFSTDGETEEELYRTGLESIVEKIEETSKNSRFVQPAAEEDDKTETQVKKITPATQIVIWVLILVALCTLSALIIDSVMAGSASLSESTNMIVSEINNFFLR